MKNKKSKKVLIIKIVLLILIIGIISAIIFEYFNSEDIRNYIDYKILNKQINDDKTKEIELEDSNSYFCTYGNYIGIINNSTLKIYNSSAKKEGEINISITTPIINSNQRYLVIGEKNGNKLYMISGKNIIWQTEVDGELTNVNVNINGYVSVITTQSTYKTVVTTYDPKGNELFKSYLSNSYAIDTEISNNNKYLAIAEINTNSTKIQSNVRILSMEKVENQKEDYVIFDKTAQQNQMIVDIKYNNQNNLIAIFDDEIDEIVDKQPKTLIKFDKDTLFANIEMDKSIVQARQISEDLGQANTEINILNITNKNQFKYNIEKSIPRELISEGDKVALNTGMDVYILNENGFLIKRYTSKQEINKVILGKNVACIVYKDKIELVKV